MTNLCILWHSSGLSLFAAIGWIVLSSGGGGGRSKKVQLKMVAFIVFSQVLSYQCVSQLSLTQRFWFYNAGINMFFIGFSASLGKSNHLGFSSRCQSFFWDWRWYLTQLFAHMHLAATAFPFSEDLIGLMMNGDRPEMQGAERFKGHSRVLGRQQSEERWGVWVAAVKWFDRGFGILSMLRVSRGSGWGVRSNDRERNLQG